MGFGCKSCLLLGHSSQRNRRGFYTCRVSLCLRVAVVVACQSQPFLSPSGTFGECAGWKYTAPCTPQYIVAVLSECPLSTLGARKITLEIIAQRQPMDPHSCPRPPATATLYQFFVCTLQTTCQYLHRSGSLGFLPSQHPPFTCTYPPGSLLQVMTSTETGNIPRTDFSQNFDYEHQVLRDFAVDPQIPNSIEQANSSYLELQRYMQLGHDREAVAMALVAVTASEDKDSEVTSELMELDFCCVHAACTAALVATLDCLSGVKVY